MNLLPLVFLFLFLLSFGSSMLLQERVTTFWEELSYRTSMKVERHARNELERRKYKKAKAKKLPQSTPQTPILLSSSSKRESAFKSPRDTLHLSPSFKLNLSPLFKKDPPSPLLYETAATLLRTLYEKSLFSKRENPSSFEYLLLDAMIKKGKRLPSASSFAELFPEDPFLQETFYKLLKGTKNIDLLGRSGYPPLSDYFCLNSKEERGIHFSHASRFLLLSLFGETLSQEILEEEKKKWQKNHVHAPLTKEELHALLQKDKRAAFALSHLHEIVSFSQKRLPSEALLIIDERTGISTRKTLLTASMDRKE